MTKLASLLVMFAFAGVFAVSASASNEMEEAVRQRYLEQGYTEVIHDPGIALQADSPDEVLSLAYMDIEKADEEMKEKILEARNKVIDRYDWAADDVVAYVVNDEDRTFEIDPHFSDLFPGWDLPVVNAPVEDEKSPQKGEGGIAPYGDAVTTRWVCKDVYVQKAVEGILTGAFKTVDSVSNNTYINGITTIASSLPSGVTKYNLGYTNESTGRSISSRRNLDFTSTKIDYYGIDFDVRVHGKVGVRASNYQKSGYGSFVVDRTAY